MTDDASVELALSNIYVIICTVLLFWSLTYAVVGFMAGGTPYVSVVVSFVLTFVTMICMTGPISGWKR